MKISFIILFYNQFISLEKTIKSIVYSNIQYEIIIIDNNSKNVLYGIPNVTIIQAKNHFNKSKARNFGIKKSTGKYITFIDSDDYYISLNLKQTVGYIEHTNYSIYLTNYLSIVNGNIVNIKINSALHNNISFSPCYFFIKKNDYTDIMFDEEKYVFVQEDLFFSSILINKCMSKKYTIKDVKYFSYIYNKLSHHIVSQSDLKEIYTDILCIINDSWLKKIILLRYIKDMRLGYW